MRLLLSSLSLFLSLALTTPALAHPHSATIQNPLSIRSFQASMERGRLSIRAQIRNTSLRRIQLMARVESQELGTTTITHHLTVLPNSIARIALAPTPDLSLLSLPGDTLTLSVFQVQSAPLDVSGWNPTSYQAPDDRKATVMQGTVLPSACPTVDQDSTSDRVYTVCHGSVVEHRGLRLAVESVDNRSARLRITNLQYGRTITLNLSPGMRKKLQTRNHVFVLERFKDADYRVMSLGITTVQ